MIYQYNLLEGEIKRNNEFSHYVGNDDESEIMFNDDSGPYKRMALASDDPIDSIFLKSPSEIDFDRLQLIPLSENIVDAYKDMIAGDIYKLIKKVYRMYHNLMMPKVQSHYKHSIKPGETVDEYMKRNNIDESNPDYDRVVNAPVKLFFGENFSAILASLMNDIEECGIKTENDFRKFLFDNYFDDRINDPEFVKRTIQAKIKYNQCLQGLLKDMLKINGKVLGLTDKQILAYIQNIKTHGLKDFNQIKHLINANKDKIIQNNGELYDYSLLGGGEIRFPVGGYKRLGLDDYVRVDRLYTISTRYDIIIYSHGTSFSEKMFNNKYNKSIDEMRNKISQYNKRISILSDLVNRDYYGHIEKKI